MPEYNISQITVSSGGSSVTANLHDSQIPDVNEAIEAILDGGGSEPVLVTKTITQNGTYTASSDNADGYSEVSVDVSNSYTAQDEGKVVQSGALVVQTATSTTTNGTIDTTTNNRIVVNVANSYVAADEGKVVSNGALVAQTAYPSEIIANNTYDTTNYNSVTVNVQSSASAYPLTFLGSVMGITVTTNELYSINSGSSTSVFGYFVFTNDYHTGTDSLYFSFDSAFTPSYTSVLLSNYSGTGGGCAVSIDNGKYVIGIGGLESYRPYRIYIQTLFT